MSTDVTVFEYSLSNECQRIYTDSLGNDNLVSPSLFLQYGASPALFGPVPDLSFRGAGTWTYTERWIAEVDPVMATVPAGTELFGGAFTGTLGTTIGASADYVTAGQNSEFYRTPTAMRVRVTLDSPTGSYSKEVRFTGSGVRAMPNASPVGFGAGCIGQANGLFGATNYPNVQKQTQTVKFYGEAPPCAPLSGSINALTPGRYASYSQSGGTFESEAGSGNPLSSPGDVVTAGTGNSWVNPWRYHLRFDLVDMAGNPASAEVLFLRSVDIIKRPVDVVLRDGSFEVTVEEDYQWTNSQGTLSRWVGGLGGIQVENIVQSGYPTVASPKYPLFGVMLPSTSLNETSSPDSPLDRWLGADWTRLYDNFGTEVEVPTTATMRPPPEGQRYPVPLSGPFDPNAEFILRNLKLKEQNLWLTQPDTWQLVAPQPGSSVSGNTLTAGSNLTKFYSDPTTPAVAFGFVHPYRFLSFDADAQDAGEIKVRLTQAGYSKLFKGRVEAGISKVWIDTLNPIEMNDLPIGDFPRIDGQNVEIGLPNLESRGRYGGIQTVTEVLIEFRNNEITVSNFGGEVRYEARGRQSSPLFTYDPAALMGTLGADYNDAQNPAYHFYGHVDGKDAFRSTNLLLGATSLNNSLLPVGTYPVPTVTATPPHVDRDGQLWPMVDMVSEGVDIQYSYFYGRFGSSFVGAEEIGIWNTPSFHCSLPWGNGLTVSSAKEGNVEIKRETFDSTLHTEEIDLTTNPHGWAETNLTNFFPDFVDPFAWGATAPFENFAGIVGPPTKTLHWRYFDRNDRDPIAYVKHNETLSLGAMYWIGIPPKARRGGNVNPWNMQSWLGRLHRCHIEDGDVQYWRSLWSSASYGFDSQIAVTSTGDCHDPRMCQRADGRIFLNYQRDEIGIVEKYSDDEGSTWSEEEVLVEGGRHPMSVCGWLDYIIRACQIPDVGEDGPGVIQATIQGPGDPTPSAPVTLVDENGDAITFADDTFGICADKDGARRWHLTAVVDGETAPSDWFSSDEINLSFKRVV